MNDTEFVVIKVDGLFGKEMEQEVMRIQEKLKMDQDGILNDKMVLKMEGLITKLAWTNEQKEELF